jgi:peroxiredoxin
MRELAVLVVALVLIWPSGAAAQDPFRDLSLIKPGRPTRAKDFVVRGLTSEQLRFSDFQGSVRFINFWATWCLPCKEEMPSMEKLYRRYKEQGFTILAVSMDANTAAVAPFVTSLKLTFPIGLDPTLAVSNDYAVRALPSSFLVDRSGNVVAVALGPRDWDSSAARAVIESLLK